MFHYGKSEMTLNYQMILEMHPKPNWVVGGLIPGGEMFFYLTEKLATPHALPMFQI